MNYHVTMTSVHVKITCACENNLCMRECGDHVKIACGENE